MLNTWLPGQWGKKVGGNHSPLEGEEGMEGTGLRVGCQCQRDKRERGRELTAGKQHLP